MAKEENLLNSDRDKLFYQAQHRDRASQFISITAGDDDGVFFCEKDNAIASCCAFSPLTGISLQNVEALQTALNLNMPAGTIMQFIQMGSPVVDNVLSNYVYHRQKVSGSLNANIDHSAIAAAQYAVRNRADFLRSRTRQAFNTGVPTVLTQTHCFWTIKVPLKKAYNPLNTKDFDTEISEFLALRMQILSQFSVAGIHAEPMKNEAVLALLRKYFKIYDPWDTDYNDQELINQQILPPGARLSWGQKGFNRIHCSGISDSGERQNVGMLVINRYPGRSAKKTFHIGVMLDLLGDPTGNAPSQFGCPYCLTTTIHIPDQAKKMGAYRANQAMTMKQSNPLLIKLSPRFRAKTEGLKDMDNDILQGGNMVEVSTTLSLFHSSPSKLDTALNTMYAYYKTKGFLMGRERYIHAVTFFNNLPMNATPDSIKNLDRFKTMMARHAAHLLPILDEGTGVDNGKNTEMLFNTRRGRLCQYSLFSDTNANYNWTVIAGSGAGKSFFVQRLTQDALSLGTKIWTIDTGSSYLAAARAAGAQIIDFDMNSQISLNPFTHIKELINEIDLLLPIFCKMAKPTQGCTDTEKGLLKEAINSVFEAEGNDATIDSVVKFLNTQTGDSQEIQRDLARTLADFGKYGSMGKWFKGKNNFKAEADWTVIELSGLITNKLLCDVVLMIISTVISQEMFLTRDGRKRMLIVEEGGDRITDPSFAEFISKLYSKVRKEDGSVGVVTQTFNQMYATKFGDDIMKSAATKFFLQAEPGTVPEAIDKGYFKADAYTIYLIEQARTENDRFSEVVIVSGKNAWLCRLVETPFNRVLFSTKGDFFKELQRRVRAGEQITELVMQEAKRRYPEEFIQAA